MDLLDYKTKLFKNRIENCFEMPTELKDKITKSLFLDNETFVIPENYKTDDKEKLQTVEEIHLILNELEVFERENRKRKMMHLLEKVAEQYDDDFFSAEELLDYKFFGDKVCNIERRHLEREKHKANPFNNNLVVKINKILEDDNNGLNLTKKKHVALKKKICFKCRKEERTRVFKCDGCRKYYHRLCMKFKITYKSNKLKRRLCREC
jgi:hypothetical protein